MYVFYFFIIIKSKKELVILNLMDFSLGGQFDLTLPPLEKWSGTERELCMVREREADVPAAAALILCRIRTRTLPYMCSYCYTTTTDPLTHLLHPLSPRVLTSYSLGYPKK